MTEHAGTVYTIEPGRPFLEELARAILDGHLPSAAGQPPQVIDLPAWTILVPSRRSTRALQEAFLAVGGGRAMLLPKIRPIAEADEELDLLERVSAQGMSADEADLPAAVDPLTRRLVLTRLVMAWSKSLRRTVGGDATAETLVAGAQTPAQAVALADSLAQLMDMVETEGVSLDGLETIVPDEHAEHWQQTLAFLTLVTEHWPHWLEEQRLLSPRHRRNLLILAEARRLLAHRPDAPVIVAGVTGSIPATAELMRAVLAHDKGAVVLPGVDLDLDDAGWQTIRDGRPEHPQFGFSRLLQSLDLDRSDVRIVAGAALTPARRQRNDIIAQALRPTGTLQHWRGWSATVDRALVAEALAGVDLIAAPSAEEEAEAIALVMRHTLETPGRTAALVTPDRMLARRVAIRLASWGIRVDDSAGRPLRKTLPGAFLDLLAEVLATDFAPAPLMALLKHPLTRLGLDAGPVRRAARQLELVAFRKPYLGRGFAGLKAALEATDWHRRSTTDRAAADDLLVRLEAAVAPWLALEGGNERLTLSELAAVHARIAQAIAAPPDAVEGDVSPVWEQEAGENLASLFTSLGDPRQPTISLTPAQYADVWRTLLGSETVRARIPVHPRLFIWGPLEARLQQPDVLILGSLVEGTWPRATDPGPWLDRGMRKRLGLPAPEDEIGRAAHDFVSFLGAETVFLTHATKVAGTPTVSSRWLQRLDALLAGIDMRGMLAPAEPWLAWARARDSIDARTRIRPPEPRPPIGLRPRRLSVSDIERWLANPYALHARRILDLEPLPPLGREPGPPERGSMLHEVLSRFSERFPDQLPGDIAAEFMRLADDVVQRMTGVPKVAAFWMPRLERFAIWFAETEPARRKGLERLVVEVTGKHVLDAPAGPFELRARADRIDVIAGAAVITDYKTGALPSKNHVADGLAPQLPLEAALLQAGAFTGLPTLPVSELRYIRASGGAEAGKQVAVASSVAEVDALASRAMSNLAALVAAFDDVSTPYRATRKSGIDYRYDDYAHLARLAEWLGEADDEPDEEGA